MRTVEFRALTGLTVEARAAGVDAAQAEMVLTGYAAKFNSRSKNLGGFYEQVAPGAFKRSLAAGDDCKALFNHDKNLILGRRDSGTLTVEEDATGLKFRCLLNPASQQHRDIYEAVKRRDITECSFAFTINGDAGESWKPINEQDESGNQVIALRTLVDLNLLDVSAVTYPAYNTTDVAARNVTPEIRSALDTLTKGATNMPVIEKRAEASYEDAINAVYDKIYAVNNALWNAFPQKLEDGNFAGYCKFYLIETYPDSVIVCENCVGPDYKWFKITYTVDAEGKFTFGEPVQVEQAWVPSERSIKRIAERRTEQEQRSLQSKANDHKDQAAQHDAAADAHSKEAEEHKTAAEAIQREADAAEMCSKTMGDCDKADCRCQNCMVTRSDVWEDDPADDIAADDDTEDIRSAKAARREARRANIEVRADSKVLTKKVDGKNLTKDKFAFVGDPEKTETWKLPIHDADHVRNALARFNQTDGIPAEKKAGVLRKIKAAAKKFGIDVSDEASRSVPMDHEEIVDALNRARAAMLVGQV